MRSNGNQIGLMTTWMRRAIACSVVIGMATLSALAIDVTDAGDSGGGTLRDAIIAANNNPGPDVINVLTSGPINLATPLPVITDAVRIISLSSPRTELNGLATQNGPTPSIGFDFQASNCSSAPGVCYVWGFAINRFGDAGIRVGPLSGGVVIAQNYIGTNQSGDSLNCPDAAHPCGNFNAGIRVEGASGVVIGTDAAALPDPACGVGGCSGHGNTIGGNGFGIVVGNAFDGQNQFHAGQAFIHNNYIGQNDPLPAQPTVALPNYRDGILIAGTSGNEIGGIGSGDTNFIGGNNGNGINIVADRTQGANQIVVDSPATNNSVRGNNIGYTGGTNQTIPNVGSGVAVSGSTNTIGGTTLAARNVITGNHGSGISIYGTLATGNVVQGNYIGVGNNGSFTALGNDISGIQISQNASNNLIGGSGATPGSCNGPCNIIANNGLATSQSAKAGIYIDPTAGVGNTVRENSIYSNGSATTCGTVPNTTVGPSQGIDLGNPCKDTNDTPDADNVQNSPTITSANTSGFITGTLSSTANTVFTIDFYVNNANETGSAAQGRTWIGSKQVTTDGSGNVTPPFSFTTNVPLTAGQNVSATATRGAFASGANLTAAPAAGATSEFSPGTNVITSTTAAAVSVSGRVLSNVGRGVSGAIITMADQNGHTVITKSNAFGYFNFANIPSGSSFVVTTQSRGFTFDPFLLQVKSDLTDVAITAK